MTLIGWSQILLYCAIIAALVRPLGGWMTRVIGGEVGALAAIERPIWRLTGADPDEEQSWLGYALALLTINLACFSRALRAAASAERAAAEPWRNGSRAAGARLQHRRPVRDEHRGEGTMSHLTQMAGLTVQNFVSAATGIAVAVNRGFARASTQSVFWVDLKRISLFVLLPISAVLGLVLVAQGMPHTLAGAVNATTLEGAPPPARSPRRSRSRCSAPTAAASSTPTQHTR